MRFRVSAALLCGGLAVSAAVVVVASARANGVGRLAFWNLNRDQKCATGETYGSCTKLSQSPLDFTDAFTG